MSHRRAVSASHAQTVQSGYRKVDYGHVEPRRYASSTSGITYAHCSGDFSAADEGDFTDEESYCIEGPSPHGTYYTTANPRINASRPRPIPQSQSSTHPQATGYHTKGYRSGNDQPRSIPCSEYGLPRGSYSGNFSQPGRYATSYQNRRAYSASHGGRNLRQTYPSDHYDEAGNYVGPPAVDSYSNDLVSFPRLPESDHSSPELGHGNQGGSRPNSTSETPNKRSFSEQLVDGVRGLLATESKEDEVPPQPPRTGVYLFCRHYLIEECACITPLEDGGPGDYCQRCWEGRCDGPRPPGSVVRRSLW
ncbi:uncharacterized protein FRV6_03947 [Fusarium oxysporum]|uniref:Uncharacterized protein n=1 Tax=Fusarium oxysporum TaxID=5507 RepID=A0A2H3T4W3_FUSOX|nr:uncharacterized protein FRV6_03947 [Fusarium oxysporum]